MWGGWQVLTAKACSDHLIFSNTFTVVSLAREETRLTISDRREGSRKFEAISAVHCWMEGQPVGGEGNRTWRKHYKTSAKPSIIQLGQPLTQISHEGDPGLAGVLVDWVQKAHISFFQLRRLLPAQPQTRCSYMTAFHSPQPTG